MVGILKKRPCRVCGRWFLPDRRAGDRQKVCSHQNCQKERHRRNCRDYHAGQSEDMKVGRVLARVRKDGSTERTEGGSGVVLAGLDWDAVRDLVGLQSAVIFQETGKVLHADVRDLVRLEVAVMNAESGEVLLCPP